MKISYLITCSTETDTFKRLLRCLIDINQNTDDEIVVLLDKKYSNVGDPSYEVVMNNFHDYCGIPTERGSIISHNLDNNYGAHKNFGIEHCNGDFIFQIDGDEMPPDALLGDNLHALLESNPEIEAYAVPRINDFKGATSEDAKKWGWSETRSEKINGTKYAWPDFQWRIFRRDYPRISFKKRLHEKIEGYDKYCILPVEEDYALYHDKTIAIQNATNERYNKMFTQDENRGISNPR